jgi:phosphoglycerate kinase
LGKNVAFIDDVCGPAAREAVKTLKAGEILLLDNVRFVSEEQTLFETKLCLSAEEQAKTLLVRKLAPLADIYVCDAFAAAHRDQPSLCGFEQLLPSAMGRLFEKEFSVISGLIENPARPSIFVLGGAKIADAFLMMSSVLQSGAADTILTGGLVGEVLLWADNKDIGEAAREFIKHEGYGELVQKAAQLLEKYRSKIIMPTDFAVVASEKRVEYPLGNIPESALILDIGSKTALQYQNIIGNAGTVFTNGPMGVFEKTETELGTKLVWDALGKTKAYTVVGGGDSITATKKYGKEQEIDYICTGGGALIRFLTGEELPVVKALRFGSNVNK